MAVGLHEEVTGSLATYETSGTAFALHVYDISSSAAGGAGSTSLFDLSGTNFYFIDPNTIGVIGSVNIGAPSTIGSYTGMANGSVAITNTPNVLVGSTAIHGTVDVTQSTDPWIILGSTQITNPSDIGSYTGQANGSVTITNVPNVLLGSTAIHGNVNVTQDSTLRQISAGSVIVTAGSIHVNSPATIGSYTGQANGSVAITNVPNVLIGSVALHGVGSQLITNQPTVDIGSVPSSTGTFTGSIWATTSSTQLLALNLGRRGFSLYNNGTEDVFINLGSAATLSDYTLAPGVHFSDDGIQVFTGAINAIVAAGSEDVRIIEKT